MGRKVLHYLIDFDRAYCNDRLRPRRDGRGTDGILSKTRFLALPWDRQCRLCHRRLMQQSGPHRSYVQPHRSLVRLPTPGGPQLSFPGAQRRGQKLVHYLLDLSNLRRAMCTDRLGGRRADGLLSKTRFLKLPLEEQCKECRRRLLNDLRPYQRRGPIGPRVPKRRLLTDEERALFWARRGGRKGRKYGAPDYRSGG